MQKMALLKAALLEISYHDGYFLTSWKNKEKDNETVNYWALFPRDLSNN